MGPARQEWGTLAELWGIPGLALTGHCAGHSWGLSLFQPSGLHYRRTSSLGLCSNPNLKVSSVQEAKYDSLNVTGQWAKFSPSGFFLTLRPIVASDLHWSFILLQLVPDPAHAGAKSSPNPRAHQPAQEWDLQNHNTLSAQLSRGGATRPYWRSCWGLRSFNIGIKEGHGDCWGQEAAKPLPGKEGMSGHLPPQPARNTMCPSQPPKPSINLQHQKIVVIKASWLPKLKSFKIWSP